MISPKQENTIGIFDLQTHEEDGDLYCIDAAIDVVSQEDQLAI
jgi:hypothetical protein